jgi:hypothetical protein
LMPGTAVNVVLVELAICAEVADAASIAQAAASSVAEVLMGWQYCRTPPE